MVLLPGCACCGGATMCYCVVAQCTENIEVTSPTPLAARSLDVNCAAWSHTSTRTSVTLSNPALWPYGAPAPWLTQVTSASFQKSSANNSVFDGLSAEVVYDEAWSDNFFNFWDLRVEFDVGVYCTDVPTVGFSLKVWIAPGSTGIVPTSLRLWCTAAYALPAICEPPPGRGCTPTANSTWYASTPVALSFGGGVTSLGPYQQRIRYSYGVFDPWLDQVEAAASASFSITSRSSCI